MKAIILAAGFSSRMGRLKQTMPIRGVPMVRGIAERFRDAGLGVVVVLGHGAARVRAALRGVACEFVLNPTPESGMFASVQSGCALIPPGQGCLLIPGDCPGVQIATIRALQNALEANPASVVIPMYQGRRGHPVGMPAHVVERVRSLPATTPGLRTVWPTERVIELPVDDAAVLRDLDRPEDVQAIKKQNQRTVND